MSASAADAAVASAPSAGVSADEAAAAGGGAPAACAIPTGSDARLSDTLEVLASGCAGERISFDDLAGTLGDKCYAGLMFLLAAPNILPLPPGASGILGIPLILLSAQLTIGIRRPWFPALMRERGIATSKFAAVGTRLEPMTRRAEAMLTRRLTLLTGVVGRRLIGLASLLLAVVLALPIPLGNVVPAIGISLFAFGLLARDGLAVLGGYAAAVGTAAILYGLGYGAFEAFEWVTGRFG
ncbi:exopolysaccharide biosynthesis protein [Sphingoaurantiacus capsulatus]|uniref:Exopolysaccharide biosynthesis protein n=1 Tax=Sphingoaurantiacus capsulatus TaxID=1771310 RepID=A0ABV7XA25_9SPHN